MIGKTLLIFTMIASVLLAGVAIVAFFAVPGMQPAMAELSDYSFQQVVGEKVTWSVERLIDDPGTVATPADATPFEAVVSARNDMAQRLRNKSNELKARHEEVTRQFARIEAEQQQDVIALTAAIEEKKTLADSYESDVKQISQEFQDLSVQARASRDEAASRRQDVVRLQAELEELRTEHFRLQQIHRTLVDRLLRLRLDCQRLQLREEQMQQQLTGT